MMKLIKNILLGFCRLLAVGFIFCDDQINRLFRWLSQGEWDEDQYEDIFLK